MSSPPLTVTAPQLRPPFGYIAIEGPIGVGKTSLARRLAQRWSMHELFERSQDNPFLERFYRDTTRYALPVQLHFALQRAQQAQEVSTAQASGTPLIADFITQRNDIFARLTLQEDEWQLYRALAMIATHELVVPRSIPMILPIFTNLLTLIAAESARWTHLAAGRSALNSYLHSK